MDSDLKMVASYTFSCILSEIQLSNLNYSIQMTPFAAQITLKKSTQKDQDGVHLLPSPPLLHLLQEAQREINNLKEKMKQIESTCEIFRTKNENLAIENAANIEAFDEVNKALVLSNTTHQEVLKKFENLEKKEIEVKFKDTKTKLVKEVHDLKADIKMLEKTKKFKEKENFDLNRNLVNARDTIKNIKSEKSQLKISKSKLETDMRKLLTKPTRIISNENDCSKKILSSKAESKVDTTLINGYFPPFLPSMISHFIPVNSVNQTSSSSLSSMYAHCVPSPYSSGSAENEAREDLTALMTEIREQFRKDTAMIIAEMKNDLGRMFNR